MTVSTDGQICYGIRIPEGAALPWEKWDNDIENWWLFGVCGYRNPFELYNDRGEYLDGVRPPQETIERYYATRRAFQTDYPMPVTLVNCCSHEYPIYIVAIPRTVISAHRGDPQEIHPRGLTITEHERDLLIRFCKDHGIETIGHPTWWLSSLWS